MFTDGVKTVSGQVKHGDGKDRREEMPDDRRATRTPP
jgi:hypothetical protein